MGMTNDQRQKKLVYRTKLTKGGLGVREEGDNTLRQGWRAEGNLEKDVV